jgi:putative endonuclease
VRYPIGELDLVMRDGDALVFVEVRQRSRADYGGALQSLTPAKLRRMARAAQLYLLKHPRWQMEPCRFDVVAVNGDGQLDWQRAAFTLDDLR